ncbi:nuclear transport factor 2 family protein [Mycobacterium sp. UM_CSW]|uniref:nuclear transport factor 2 family protein n=1 Tax=Mycobacterium sp. UM_CSW TaxID=1370119 RepID=UPI000420F2AB|nr:nuclear transport factor 2 family protein [Mycobacterium sp. UM_CSW]
MDIGIKSEIAELVDRYLCSLDERKFDDDWARGFFTEDAVVTFPIGNAEGIDSIVANTRRGVLQFVRTQHLGLNYLVDADPGGRGASARWNQVNHHVHPEGDLFTSGTWCEAEFVRGPAGWRIARTAMHVTWTSGRPPGRPS